MSGGGGHRAESGTQLLARLEGRRSLRELEPHLFADEDAPVQGEILELHGPEGTGKTEMLYHLAARCLLPQAQGGLELEVLLLDTDAHFDLLRLVSVLERRLPPGGSGQGEAAAEEALRRCLGRLFVARCGSSVQLLLTLHALEPLLCGRPALGLLVVDSLSAFYWLDRAAGGESPRAQEATLARCAQLLRRLAREHRLLVLATTQSLMQRAPAEAPPAPAGPGLPDYRPYLCRAWQDAVGGRLLFSKAEASAGGPGFSVAWRRAGSSAARRLVFLVGEGGVELR